MPAERLSMRRVREILRLRHLGLMIREIARSLEMSPTTVASYLLQANGSAVLAPPGGPRRCSTREGVISDNYSFGVATIRFLG